MKTFSRLFVLLFFISTATLAQKKGQEPVVIPDMPINVDTKLISYTDVVEVDSTTMKTLFKRSLKWANGYYVNPTDVIREKDAENGKVVIKARYRIYTLPDKEGTKALAGDVLYTMTIDFKDNKYRYEITNFIWQKRSAFPIERWMDDTSDSFLDTYAYYLEQTDEFAKELITSFTTRMATEEKAKKDDW